MRFALECAANGAAELCDGTVGRALFGNVRAKNTYRIFIIYFLCVNNVEIDP